MLKIGSKIFDGIFSEVNRKKIETFTIWSATIGFVFHLSLVLLNNYSIIVDIKLSEETDKKKFLNSKEKLEMIQENNESIISLIEEFNLRI